MHRTACSAGLGASCAAIARMYRTGTGVATDLTQSTHFDTQACTLGEMRSCSLLANAYRRGVGVRRDEAQARQLDERACSGGDDMGCQSLDDKPSVAPLWEVACRNGRLEACVTLANQYAHGDGVIADASRAASLYEPSGSPLNAMRVELEESILFRKTIARLYRDFVRDAACASRVMR